MGRGWKSFEVHVRNMVRKILVRSQVQMRNIFIESGRKTIFIIK